VAPAAPDGLGVNVAGVETLPDPAAAAAPTFATGALIPIDEADTMPVSLLRRSPVYSEQARQMKASGTVIMNVLINERGSVDQAVLVTGVPAADLNEAAIRAAKTWTYRPATKNGVPVKVWKSEQIVFKR
jgi:protein TonB